MIKATFSKSLNGANGKFLLQVDCTIENNDFVSIFGKSGAGKSTILRILCGLDSPNEGEIWLDNKLVFSSTKKINIPPQKRNVGFVFQDYALLPHLNVYKNLCFGLKKGYPHTKVDEILEFMELTHLKARYPNELSGGQKQRVALARTLCYEAKILLLDEPLSAIDNDMRGKLQDEILHIHKHFGLTTILVSHDISEVFKLSNRILMLKNGKIIRDGSANSVFGESSISGKFSFYAKILEIKKNGLIYIIKILINNNIATITMGDEARDFSVGDDILVASKAFNPMVFKA